MNRISDMRFLNLHSLVAEAEREREREKEWRADTRVYKMIHPRSALSRQKYFVDSRRSARPVCALTRSLPLSLPFRLYFTCFTTSKRLHRDVSPRQRGPCLPPSLFRPVVKQRRAQRKGGRGPVSFGAFIQMRRHVIREFARPQRAKSARVRGLVRSLSSRAPRKFHPEIPAFEPTSPDEDRSSGEDARLDVASFSPPVPYFSSFTRNFSLLPRRRSPHRRRIASRRCAAMDAAICKCSGPRISRGSVINNRGTRIL